MSEMTRWFVLLVGCLMIAVPAVAQPDTAQTKPKVTLRFEVRVPADTSTEDTVYVCGNLTQLGQWDGMGLALARDDAGVYHGEITVDQDTSIEYKLTRGSWATVEKGIHGQEIENRVIEATTPKTVGVTVARWATPQAEQLIEPTLTGNIHLHEAFHSTLLDNERDVIVYLPPGYDDEPERRYPVLYMHDGQNLFDAATSFAGAEWRVDEAAQKLIKAGEIEPIIIVGISNTPERMHEYDPDDGPDGGTLYTRFVVEEVKPFIEKTYRVDADRDRTGIAGSSLGGLISLYMAKAHGDVFSRCGVVSPALGYHDRQFLNALEAEDTTWLQDVRLWVDMGTAEAHGSRGNLALQDVHDLVTLLEQAGLERGKGYQYMEVEGGQHNEQAWSERIEAILTFLYGV